MLYNSNNYAKKNISAFKYKEKADAWFSRPNVIALGQKSFTTASKKRPQKIDCLN